MKRKVVTTIKTSTGKQCNLKDRLGALSHIFERQNKHDYNDGVINI